MQQKSPQTASSPSRIGQTEDEIEVSPQRGDASGEEASGAHVVGGSDVLAQTPRKSPSLTSSGTDGEQRFIIREVTGYGINPGRHSGGGNRPPITDVMILDRAYCHRVVSYFKASGNGQPRLAARQKLAEYHCAKLNAEDA